MEKNSCIDSLPTFEDMFIPTHQSNSEMNKSYFIACLCVLFLISGSSLFAQDYGKLDKSSLDVAYYPSNAAFRAFEKDEKKRAQAEPIMRLIYSRPKMAGRSLFGSGENDLIKYGKVWRLGANENAELTVMKAVNIGGQTIEPGRYSVHTIPNEDSWTLIINTDIDGWGSYAYNEANDVARINAAVHTMKEPVEALSVLFRDHSLDIAWGTTLVSVPVNPAAGLDRLDKSPLDISYYPARSPFRAFEKDEAKKAGLDPVMRIMYSRTMKKDRSLYGSGEDDLVKYGEVWRLGANENAELHVMKTANIGGKTIDPGRYGVYVIPEKDSWTLILNKDLDGWGAYAYNEANDVMRVTGDVSSLDEEVEALSVLFSETSLLIAWGKTLITFPVKG
ncbi:MAG: DUF2911 domain-containing protein [Bacteroidota bacterium]